MLDVNFSSNLGELFHNKDDDHENSITVKWFKTLLKTIDEKKSQEEPQNPYGSFSKSSAANQFAHTDFKDLSVELQLSKLTYQRPWLNSSVFKNCMIGAPGLEKFAVSSGKNSNYSNNEQPLLPYLTVSAIVARDVKITGFDLESEQTKYVIQKLESGEATRLLFFDFPENFQ